MKNHDVNDQQLTIGVDLGATKIEIALVAKSTPKRGSFAPPPISNGVSFHCGSISRRR